jgi:putative Mg2+ transporter-C (MgtC) family protein
VIERLRGINFKRSWSNILLSVDGKAPDSFGAMDLMRLPLGILTGVGFIGGGAILKRGDLVTGVTTASTLWVTTVIGLCLGGGQLGLGSAATILAVLTLWSLKWLDVRMVREPRAKIIVESNPVQSSTEALTEVIAPLGFKALILGQTRDDAESPVRLCYELTWKRPEIAGPPIDLFKILNDRFCVISVELISEASINE